ncbi:hypothetical protein NDN08_000457 [Rhodosorus marinus]|uniref:SnoaL-like domain-containing protein n=1 Tax=Rhodosorus marinus TaxID=101924 RepID=A0AAV8UTL2_9RHOD|nr:hypothetical protein NDN08_000457 [Rhodosorus marinus]
METGFVSGVWVRPGHAGSKGLVSRRSRLLIMSNNVDGFEGENILRNQIENLKKSSSKLHGELNRIRENETGFELPPVVPLLDRAPREGLSVEDTIRIQLMALQRNDFPEIDAGIATAFEFAAPMNRMSVGGSANDFAKFVKSSIYAMLVDCKEWQLSSVTITSGGRRASAVSLITDFTGNERKFLWNLGIKKVWDNGQYQECWLVDACIAFDYKGRLVIE